MSLRFAILTLLESDPGSGYDLMVFGAVAPAEPPDVVLADNGTQVAAASVTVGTPSHVLHKFQITVSESIATLNAVALTTTGAFVFGDLAAVRIRAGPQARKPAK